LLVRKKAGEELDLEPRRQVLNAFIEEKLGYYQKYVKSLGKKKEVEVEALNVLFRKTLEEVWK
jgi:predicted nucleotidyltransferase